MKLYKQMRTRKTKTYIGPFVEYIVDILLNPTSLIELAKSECDKWQVVAAETNGKETEIIENKKEEKEEEFAAKFQPQTKGSCCY